MIQEMILSQIEFAITFILAVTLAYRFYKWKDGRLRVIMIWFFIAIAIDFGVNWIYYALWDLKLVSGWDEVLLRDITHLPKMLVMISLWRFMRK